MRTEDFDFDLPRELIAQHPVAPRDSARLLEVGAELREHRMRDLPMLLRPGDLMVYNDTRVLPARLFGRRGDARVEVTLYQPIEGTGSRALWRAFARPARRLREGDRIDFAPDLHGHVAGRGAGGAVVLAFDLDEALLRAALERIGAMPLPPYIRRQGAADPRDKADYQTIFAARDGAIAAPTAGLHFTPALLAALEARGIRRAPVTLHVGIGTFLPVTVKDPRDHRMHAESAEIGAETAAAVNQVRADGGRVLAVGSTSLRLLESAVDAHGWVRPFSGQTDLFILPGFRFRAVDILLTNFHLPCSTLFMLVCAFAGTERMKRAYEHAKQRGFRFYSYGDACLLERAPA